jgi:hypothetical protein
VPQQQHLEAADDPDRGRVHGHRQRVVEVLAEERGRERHEGDEAEIEEIEVDEPAIERAHQGAHLVVSDPVAADHREADRAADELLGPVVEGVGEVADAVHAADLARRGHRDPDHQQGGRDREQAVAERQHARELLAPALEPLG